MTKLGYKDLKWLQDVSSVFENADNGDIVQGFVLLIAADHPEIFQKTRERIESGNYDTGLIEAAIDHTTGMTPDPKISVRHGAATALLTQAQLNTLRAVSGGQQDHAKKLLHQFDPDFERRNSGHPYADYYWTRELPNIAAFGC